MEITELTAKAVEQFNIRPRIAMLTYSNFGTADGEDAVKMREATAILAKESILIWLLKVKMQAHMAFDTDFSSLQNYPFSKLADEGANVLIFLLNLAANISYNLLKETGDIETVRTNFYLVCANLYTYCN